MVMDIMQIRMNRGLIDRIDSFVNSGVYSNRSDVIRDAVRRFVWEKEAGSIKSKGNSISNVRKTRKFLSKQKINLKKINEL